MKNNSEFIHLPYSSLKHIMFAASKRLFRYKTLLFVFYCVKRLKKFWG